MVKKLLTELGASFKAIELNVEGDGGDIQSALAEWTGQCTVPNVFIGGKHIGGCDSTTALHKNGKLVPLLTEAGAVAKADRCCIVVTGARVLYLGAAFGITISHVSDFVGAEGVVYAVESHSGRDLVNMAKKRINVIPIVEVARHIAQFDQMVSI